MARFRLALVSAHGSTLSGLGHHLTETVRPSWETGAVAEHICTLPLSMASVWGLRRSVICYLLSERGWQ